MLGLSYFRRRTPSTQSDPAFISQLEKIIKRNEQFMDTIQNWRSLQIKYIGEMIEIQSKIRDRMEENVSKADCQFYNLFESVIKCHKNLITRINQEVFETSLTSITRYIQEQKHIMDEEKTQTKNFASKKEQYSKLKEKDQKLKKSLLQELVQQICARNSVSESQQKQKIQERVEEINKQQDEHDIKMKEAKQQYNPILQKSKQNLKRFGEIQQSIGEQSLEIVNKAKNCIHFLGDSLSNDPNSKTSTVTDISSGIEGSVICEQFENEEESILDETHNGYLFHTIEMIKDQSIDEIIQYSKNKQIKKKIKLIIQSSQTNPQITDQITRQTQLVKKMLKTRETSLIQQFKHILKKNNKNRMNFIFMLQFYRINNQFEIKGNEIEIIILLISQLLKICHLKKDTFVIKQVIVLFLTYYININNGSMDQKVYIIEFFKSCKQWKSLQLWQSMLIQNIYSQKKAAIKILLKNSCILNKNQVLETEKVLILNQILYIVKNMIVFNFNESEVKEFVNKFGKLFKQDNRFLKDLYMSIDEAIKEEDKNKYSKQQLLEKSDFSKLLYCIE